MKECKDGCVVYDEASLFHPSTPPSKDFKFQISNSSDEAL